MIIIVTIIRPYTRGGRKRTDVNRPAGAYVRLSGSFHTGRCAFPRVRWETTARSTTVSRFFGCHGPIRFRRVSHDNGPTVCRLEDWWLAETRRTAHLPHLPTRAVEFPWFYRDSLGSSYLCTRLRRRPRIPACICTRNETASYSIRRSGRIWTRSLGLRTRWCLKANQTVDSFVAIDHGVSCVCVCVLCILIVDS